MRINKLGSDWLMAKAWLEERIEQSRLMMESGLSSDGYNFERGQIALARAMIEAVEPTTPPQTVEDNYDISTPEDGKYT